LEDSICTWGNQLLDNHFENESRAFIAISKKCYNRLVHCNYTKDTSGEIALEQNTYNTSGYAIGEIPLPSSSIHVYILSQLLRACDSLERA